MTFMERQINKNSISKMALQLIRELFNWIRSSSIELENFPIELESSLIEWESS